jgi:flagellar assembly protein FliH
MAKTVFRPQEIVPLTSKYVLDGPDSGSAQAAAGVEETLPLDEYMGPTADDLRREAEAFKANWDKERETMIASARAEADAIIQKAEAAAFDEVKRRTDQAQKLKTKAEEEATAAVEAAEARIRELETQAKERIASVHKAAFRKGFDEGRESGYKEGKAEVERLTGRLHAIIERALDKRGEILEKTEAEIVELVLLVAKKVVKVISENQKNVVVQNIVQALRKLRTRSEVTIRVNLADLQLASEHAKDFVAMAENAKHIQIVEDTTIDRGGCIIETDFGEIDARISSQLHELEEKILDISPIKARGKPTA